MLKRGVLLVNLGSPDSSNDSVVRKYLREFPMDGRVVDVPRTSRRAIVNGALLPFREPDSAEAYSEIWTVEASPLAALSARLQRKLSKRLQIPVELGMRYQNPTIESALKSLVESAVEAALVVPLFPHSPMSSFESAMAKVKQMAAKTAPELHLSILPPYYYRREYIGALTETASPYLDRGFDHLLFSFVGMQERHLIKSNPGCGECLNRKDFCERPEASDRQCYRRHCIETMNRFAAIKSIPAGKFNFAFQSKIGVDTWLKPATHEEVTRLAKSGVRRLMVICPTFTVDCVETIEDIGMRAKEAFLAGGGSEFTLIPCLNDHPAWVDGLARMVEVATIAAMLLGSGFGNHKPDPGGFR